MASPTNTYCDYATGNDYKGYSFVNGAYTSATKLLLATGAFVGNQVNHWLYLSDNGSNTIYDGYYKIAAISGTSTVWLSTDAGSGTNSTDVVCNMASGTVSLPWRSVQGALDLITRDATNGNQVNIKAGTAQVNQASLTLATYGTPAAATPLILRGYTTVANDRGMCEINCNGVAMWAATTYDYLQLMDCQIHNFGNNNGVVLDQHCLAFHCNIHKGASTPTSKSLLSISHYSRAIGNYIHDAGTTGIGITSGGDGNLIYGNYFADCSTGIFVAGYGHVIYNIVYNCTVYGISLSQDNFAIGNSISATSAATGRGIVSTSDNNVILNNIIQGFSGTGGIGINTTKHLSILGYNTFYNNATNETLGDVIADLGNDVALSVSPFTDAASEDFSLSTANAGAAIDGAYPGAFYGPASTTDHADIGAVQNGAGSGGGAVRISPAKRISL